MIILRGIQDIAGQGGDRLEEDIFVKIYREYYKHVYRYLYSMTFDSHKAEDMAQDVFVKAFCLLDFPNGKIKSWLLMVAHNLYVDHLKKNKRLEFRGDESLLKQPDGDIHKTVQEKEALSQVILQLKILPEAQRQAVVLCLIDEMGYAEAAEIMGLTVSAVTNLIYRARKTLRALRRLEE